MASRTLTEPLAWENSTLLQGEAEESVALLRKERGEDIVVLGSGDLLHTLVRAGLVDRYILLARHLSAGGDPPPPEVLEGVMRDLDALNQEMQAAGVWVYGRAVAVLTRVFGDIDVAEEAVQDAFTVAMRLWPERGVPPEPEAWIITTARNRSGRTCAPRRFAWGGY